MPNNFDDRGFIPWERVSITRQVCLIWNCFSMTNQTRGASELLLIGRIRQNLGTQKLLKQKLKTLGCLPVNACLTSLALRL